jgi:hypothetical protein
VRLFTLFDLYGEAEFAGGKALRFIQRDKAGQRLLLVKPNSGAEMSQTE